MNKVFARFKDKITKASNVVLTTHIVPDADGIGSEIALCLALRQMGKNAICVNEEHLLERYHYLDPFDVVVSLEEYNMLYANAEVDLCIIADTNSLERIGAGMKKIASKAKDILYIDHHPCSKEVMDKHCVDTSKAATGELAGDLIESVGINFSREMALPLYTAILIDTSSFRYPTVTGNTHRLIGKLMDTGVRPPHAYNMVYGTKKLSYMKLLGRVLSTAHTTKDEKISWLSLTEDILEKFNVDPEDTHAFINHLLVLDNIKIACMFREMNDQIKVSLRSTGAIDVGIMAQALGGGGHDHSAACLISGSIESVTKTVIEKLQVMLAEAESKMEGEEHNE